MIRIFEEREVDFSHDGIEILDDITISCTCEREVNGTWFLDAQFMRDNDKCNSIENKKILKVPTPKGEQLFRIVTIKSTKTKISVYAEHIFFDNRHNFIEDTNVVKKDGNNALQQILTGCQYKNKFTGVSTVPTVASARLVRKNLTDVLMGSDDNSYLNRWGGEIDFDNFQFTIKPRIGEDRGVEVTYGHNMKSFEGEVDESGVITRVMPIGFNGLLLPEKYIDSPLIDSYSFPRVQKIEISSIKVKENENDEEGYDTEEEAFEAMRRCVSDLYSKQNIDKPSVNLRVDIISLEKTDQYKNEIFERIYIGDTLKVNLQKYGFDVSCRVISERYDCLNSRYIEIELGDVKTNVLREVTSIKQTIDDILDRFGENSWDDFIQKARDEATQLIQEGIKGSFVVARKNEILIMDNEDIEKARTVIRMNKNGIGFSQTGYSGPYIIGITIDGKINADCITTGILNANLIRTGRLQSLNNKTWIDMEDGAFSFANGRITFDEVNGFKIKLSSDSDVDLKTELDNYKNQVKNDLDSLKDKINNIDESISDSFVDGIISQVERNIIEDSLKTLEKEKLDVDSRYNSVYNNVNLINPYKSNLYTQYNDFVSKYNTLVSTINSIIADDIATNEEIERYNAAMGNYAETTPKLMAAFDEAITNISTNITSTQINDLNDLLKADIKNVSNSVGSLEETMNNSFRDGIIDEAEYIAIVESLQRLNTEKLDIDKNYSSLYSNSNLVGTAKTNLKTKYDNYVSSHNNLINYVNNTIGDRVATDSEKQQIKTLLNTYNINLSEYGVAQTQAINSIADNSSQTKLQEYKNLVNKDIDDLNQKIKDIETDVGGAIADGIIQEAEVLIIQNSINALEKEKLDLKNRYTELYNNSLVSTTTKKKLSDNFTSYSNAHTSLINQINSMISDNVATDDEKAEYNKRMATYSSTFSALTKTFDLVINEIAVNNAQTITETLKTELQGNIKDVSDIANELNKNFGDYTADGILTESEKKSIKTYLTNLETEKNDIDNQYKVLYENVDLTGTTKSSLKSGYDDYVTYYNKLIEVINKTLGYTTITDSHRTALNTAFANHDTRLATYSRRVNRAINAIAEKKKQDAQSYADSKIEVLSDKISTFVTKDTYKSQIEQLSNQISSKVSTSDFGTLITQNASSVRIAWNNNSKYVQFESGGLAIYNAAVSTSNKRLFLNEKGVNVWRDGYYLGKVGTNNYSENTSLKGFVFDLEYEGAFMSWAVKKSSSSTSYTMKWCYANKTIGNYTSGRLHAGADIDMHNYTLRNVKFEGGGITGTLNFVQILGMDSDGTANRWSNGCKMQFQNGILISATWSNS